MQVQKLRARMPVTLGPFPITWCHHWWHPAPVLPAGVCTTGCTCSLIPLPTPTVRILGILLGSGAEGGTEGGPPPAGTRRTTVNPLPPALSLVTASGRHWAGVTCMPVMRAKGRANATWCHPLPMEGLTVGARRRPSLLDAVHGWYLLPLPPGIKNLLRPSHVVRHAATPQTGYYSVMKMWGGEIEGWHVRAPDIPSRDAPLAGGWCPRTRYPARGP
jgi:hypothetical protein